MSDHAFGSPLHRAAHLLASRLEALEARVRQGDEASWPEYRETAVALAHLQERTAPELLKTKELAQRMGVSVKTINRRVKEGKIRPAVQWGDKGQSRRFAAGSSLPRAET